IGASASDRSQQGNEAKGDDNLHYHSLSEEAAKHGRLCRLCEVSFTKGTSQGESPRSSSDSVILIFLQCKNPRSRASGARQRRFRIAQQFLHRWAVAGTFDME